METHSTRQQGIALLEALHAHLAAAELAAIGVSSGGRRVLADPGFTPLCTRCAQVARDPGVVRPLLLSYRELVDCMRRVCEADERRCPSAVGFLLLARRQHLQAVHALADALRRACRI